jgi:hypothetical protein
MSCVGKGLRHAKRPVRRSTRRARPRSKALPIPVHLRGPLAAASLRPPRMLAATADGLWLPQEYALALWPTKSNWRLSGPVRADDSGRRSRSGPGRLVKTEPRIPDLSVSSIGGSPLFTDVASFAARPVVVCECRIGEESARLGRGSSAARPAGDADQPSTRTSPARGPARGDADCPGAGQPTGCSSRAAIRPLVMPGSTWMPGPIVVVIATFFTYRPLAADGLSLITSSIAAA